MYIPANTPWGRGFVPLTACGRGLVPLTACGRGLVPLTAFAPTVDTCAEAVKLEAETRTMAANDRTDFFMGISLCAVALFED